MKQRVTSPDSKPKISLIDWLLIIAVVLAPMTGFRIWKVGPAEVLGLFWCLLHYKSFLHIHLKDRFARFWLLFMVVVFLGSVYGYFFYPDELRLSDLLTWVYFAIISMTTCAELKNRNFGYLWKMLKTICVAVPVLYLFLFIYSQRVSRTFLGAPLWYGKYRFTGGAENPHQLALLLAVVIIGCTCLLLKEKGIRKIIYLLCVAVSIFLLIQTISSTAYMATVCGIAVILWKPFRDRFLKTQKELCVFIAVATLLMIFVAPRLYNLFMNWVASDPNGMGRFELFSNYPNTFFKSPLFGLGPGAHSVDGIELKEYHNTYLEVLAMGGLLGGLVFFVFSYHLFRTASKVSFSIAAMTTLYVYGFAGFGMRRLVYWILLSIAYLIAVKYEETSRTKPPVAEGERFSV